MSTESPEIQARDYVAGYGSAEAAKLTPYTWMRMVEDAFVDGFAAARKWSLYHADPPQRPGIYLVIKDNGNYDIGYYTLSDNEGEYPYWDIDGLITHWMSLPERPK